MTWLGRMWGRPAGQVVGPGDPGASDQRLVGLPSSSNGASSFHLEWLWRDGHPALASVSATLTLVEPPRVDRLHFWALQVSFSDGRGRRFGGGHVGLQHHSGHPGGAVNWGGYGSDGQVLAGTSSQLPSATGNVNTRDFGWEPGWPYRFEVSMGETGWAATVDDGSGPVLIRELHAGGDRLAGAMVWSEVFARCDDPSSAVRWSDFSARTLAGGLIEPVSVRTRYQTVRDGGCSNTSSVADPHHPRAVLQLTNTVRANRPGSLIELT